MKDGKYLLDSTIIINLFKNDVDVIKKIETASSIFMSSIGLGELYYGAYRSTKPDKHFLEVENLEKEIVILECTTSTSKIYGRIKNELSKIGKPIPENDIWIAAIAIEHDLTLANRDQHFDVIKELKQEK